MDDSSTARSAAVFVARTTIIHVVTYFMIGLLASLFLDYRWAFGQPVVRDYMIEYQSGAQFVGPLVQVLRGAIFGVVLLPFRSAIAGRLGWLWLWALLIGVGILSTPAAAPSSIEGLTYTRIPLWYHAFGLPEMLVQTLLFSALVAGYARHPHGILRAMPANVSLGVQALAGASFAFIGYAVVSIGFALAVGADVTAESNLSLETQGLFIAPFVANIAIAVLARRGWRPWLVFTIAWASNAVLIGVYQAAVLGGANLVYAIGAPIIPAAILSVATRAATRAAPGNRAASAPSP